MYQPERSQRVAQSGNNLQQDINPLAGNGAPDVKNLEAPGSKLPIDFGIVRGLWRGRAGRMHAERDNADARARYAAECEEIVAGRGADAGDVCRSTQSVEKA